MMLLHIDGGYWCGGAVFEWDEAQQDWICTEAPPIVRWMVGQQYGAYLMHYFNRKGWKAEWVEERP